MTLKTRNLGKSVLCFAFFLGLNWVKPAWSESAKFIFEKKCSACHTLGRVRNKKKGQRAWMRRVKKCAKKTQDWEDESKWINIGDVEYITNFLIKTQSVPKKKPLPRRGGSRGRAKLNKDVIKTAKDPGSLSSLEKIHVPSFILPKFVFTREKFKVTVKVGQRTHPMVDGHSIEWIEFYQDGILLKKFELQTGQEPQVTVLLTIGTITDLRAVVKCNKHGIWEARRHVRAR